MRVIAARHDMCRLCKRGCEWCAWATIYYVMFSEAGQTNESFNPALISQRLELRKQEEKGSILAVSREGFFFR